MSVTISSGSGNSTTLVTSVECLINDDSLEKNLKQAAYEAKTKGNDAYLKGDYDLAMKHYNTAIVMYPDEAVFFSNRSAVHFARNDMHKALQDAEWAIERRSDWYKGYFRKGKALFALRQYADAQAALAKALELDADNDEIKKALEETERIVNAIKGIHNTLPVVKGSIDRLTWEAARCKGEPPAACIWNTATLVGTRIFCFGGFDGATCLDELHILDTDAMAWIKPVCKGKPAAAYYFHTANLVGTKIYYFGGIGQENTPEEDVHSHLLVLDTDTLTWSQPAYCGIPPLFRLSHSSVTVGNTLYVFGGWDGQGKNYNELHTFNVDTMTWREPLAKGIIPEARYAHTCCVVGRKLYIIGGTDDPEIEEGLNVFKDMPVFDTETNTWSRVETTGEAPKNAIWHSVNVVGSKLFVFGGGPYSSKKKSIGLNVLDTETNVWTCPKVFGTTPIKRFGHTSTLVGARIFLYGGMGAFRGRQKIFREVHILDIAGCSLRELRGEEPVPNQILDSPMIKAAAAGVPPPKASGPGSRIMASAGLSLFGAAGDDEDDDDSSFSFEAALEEEKRFQQQMRDRAAGRLADTASSGPGGGGAGRTSGAMGSTAATNKKKKKKKKAKGKDDGEGSGDGAVKGVGDSVHRLSLGSGSGGSAAASPTNITAQSPVKLPVAKAPGHSSGRLNGSASAPVPPARAGGAGAPVNNGTRRIGAQSSDR